MATAAARKRRYHAPRATYGNVAYDLNYAETAARPLRGGEQTGTRPLVRPRERAAVRPRARVREPGAVSPFAVVGFLAIGVFAVLVLLSSIQLTTLSDDIASLKSELSELEEQEKYLRTQYELAFDLAGLEGAVTSDGTMVKPQAGQILYLDLSEPDSVVLFGGEETPVDGLNGALRGIGDILGNVVEYFR